MQYSPKLKKAAEEIKAILKKHDIGAYVLLHTPGFSEYINEISPSYSCARFDNSLEGAGLTGVRFKAKASELPGGAAEREQKIADTDNFLLHMVTGTASAFKMFDTVYQSFEKATGGHDHTKGGHTSQTEIDN
jgi:hypothetical protein